MKVLLTCSNLVYCHLYLIITLKCAPNLDEICPFIISFMHEIKIHQRHPPSLNEITPYINPGLSPLKYTDIRLE